MTTGNVWKATANDLDGQAVILSALSMNWLGVAAHTVAPVPKFQVAPDGPGDVSEHMPTAAALISAAATGGPGLVRLTRMGIARLTGQAAVAVAETAVEGGVAAESAMAAEGAAATGAAETAVAGAAEAAPSVVAGEGGALGRTAPDVVYHYTTAENAAKIQQTGLWSQSSATDVGTYTSQQAVELLGVKTPPNVVIEIQNGGRFILNRPPVVQPHPLGPGGGIDLTNPARVPPQCIRCVRAVQ